MNPIRIIRIDSEEKCLYYRLGVNEIMNNQLHDAIERIHSLYPDYRIYIFGSQARGDNTDDSDVDLCAIIPELNRDPFDIAYELRVEMKKYIRQPLDIVVVSAKDFSSRQSHFGTLENTIATEGIAV